MPRRRIYTTNAERQAAYRHRTQGRTNISQPIQAAIPALPAVSSISGRKRWRGLLGYARMLLEQTAREMEDYLEDRSEQWQSSDRGESFAETLDSVQDALAALENVLY